MSKKGSKAFITPADWTLPDPERLTVAHDTSGVRPPGCVMIERDGSEPPYIDDWYTISIVDGDVMRLHKDEIAALYEFAFGRDESAEKLVSAARRVDVLMDTLALLGIGDWLSPESQYRSDWAMFHTDLQEALLPFDKEIDQECVK